LSDKEIAKIMNWMGYKSRRFWNQITPEKLQELVQKTVYAGIVCEKWTNNKPIKAAYEW